VVVVVCCIRGLFLMSVFHYLYNIIRVFARSMLIMPETKLVMFEVAGEDDCCD